MSGTVSRITWSVLPVLLTALLPACGSRWQADAQTDTLPVDTSEVIDAADAIEAEEVGPVEPPPGCPPAIEDPDSEIVAVRIQPESVTLVIEVGQVDTAQFTATVVYRNGNEFELPAGDFQLTNPGVGYLYNTGQFLSIDNTGGESWVTLTAGGVCGSAHLRVIQVWNSAGDSGIVDPEIFLADTLQPTTGAGSPELLYPPDGALAPADFPSITVQYLADDPGQVGIVRFQSDAARFDFLFNPTAALVGEGYAVLLDKAGYHLLPAINGANQYEVTVLAVSTSGSKVTGTPRVSEGRSFTVTTQEAGGAFYYWNTGGINGSIRYLELGQEEPKPVMLPVGGCVGCHSISPEADVIAVSPFIGDGFSQFNLVLGDPITGKEPPWLALAAKDQISKSFTVAPAFSKKYWTDQDKRIVVPSSGGLGGGGLFSIDLIVGAVKKLVKGGDFGSPAFPAWSPNGAEVVYTSGPPGGMAAFAINEPCRIFKVPYNDGEGGTAQPLPGADQEGILQYYPAFSPDGLWVIFNRASDIGTSCPQAGASSGAANSGGTYDNCLAEVFMVSAAGGSPLRLNNANGTDSPGVTNSWPTFGVTLGKYYWIAFSSRRDYGFLHKGTATEPAAPQIWVAGVDPSRLLQGMDGSFAALRLPYQEIGSGNHIARWGVPPRPPM